MNEQFLKKQYEQLCKELGHLEYHKTVLEKKIEAVRQKIDSLDSLIPLALIEDKNRDAK